jgi:UDP-glucose 4-epimerase
MWLVTGGAGYIGSHVLLKMKEAGFALVTLDNLSSGLVKRIPSGVNLIEGDICDPDLVSRVLNENHIEGIINLAALKSVEESKRIPDEYERINHLGTKILVDCAILAGVKIFIQSSTAAVYGNSESGFVSETSELNPISPYGQSKVLAEKEVARFVQEGGRRGTSLRYFNVLGSESPLLKDNSKANVVPMVLEALAKGAPPEIFGDDYPTKDGTCIRDYIHVSDIARAHVLAAIKLQTGTLPLAINIGTGHGYSVREVMSEILVQSNSKVQPVVVSRREGDPAVLTSDISLIRDLLEFRAEMSLFEMIRSSI